MILLVKSLGPSPSCKLLPDLEPGHDMRGFLHLIVELRGANWAVRGLLDHHHAQKGETRLRIVLFSIVIVITAKIYDCSQYSVTIIFAVLSFNLFDFQSLSSRASANLH